MTVQELSVPANELKAMRTLLEIHGFNPDQFSAALSEYQADLGPQVRILKIQGPVLATYAWSEDGTWLEAMKKDLEAGLYRDGG